MRIADYSVTKAVLERHGFLLKNPSVRTVTDANILQKVNAKIDKASHVINQSQGEALIEFLAGKENALEVTGL